MVKRGHDDGSGAAVDQFVNARRKLLQWRRAKRIALQIADLQYPKSHPFRKSVQNLCGGNCEFRYQAEISACRTADRLGDDLFRVVIDGIYMRTGPTDFFYGDTLHQVESRDDVPEIKVSARACRDKMLNIREISHCYSLASHARAFMDAVKLLPTGARIDSAAGRQLAQCEKKLWKDYERVVSQLSKLRVDHSHTYGALLCCSRVGLHGEIGRAIISFIA
jgi:hypothetical protein